MAAEKHKFLKNGIDLFSRGALGRGDHVEVVREIGFSARVIFEVKAPAGRRSREVICSTGKSNSSLLPLWEKVARSAG
jgi:hypothetical protein